MVQGVIRTIIPVVLLSAMLLLAGCQTDSEEACPLNELPYPRPEPDYDGKLAHVAPDLEATLS